MLPWSRKREPRNIDRLKVKAPLELSRVEKGFHNWFELIGREIVDVGEVFFMLEGRHRDPYDTCTPFRYVGNVSTTIYSPKVFDVVTCRFKHASDGVSRELKLPTLVEYETRPARVTPFKCELRNETSDEYLDGLLRQCDTLKLFNVSSYEIPFDIDLSPMMWTRILELKEIGFVLHPEQKEPLLAAEIRERRKEARRANAFKKMNMQNPEEASDLRETWWFFPKYVAKH